MQFRKVIHISGAMIPVLARTEVLGKSLTIDLILAGFSIYLIIEALKPKISRDILSLVYRENELNCFSTEPFAYMLSVLSLLILSFFIDEKICFAAIAILAAGDGFAGVMGRRYGKHSFSFNKNKTWEGSISGFIAGSLTGFYFAGPIALIGGIFGMVAGAVNKQDNIAVPYGALIAMAIVRYAAVLI